MFGKWKASFQFVAIAVAILRPHVIIDDAYLDQWLMIVVAVITAWSGVDYLIHSADALEVVGGSRRLMARVFVTGGGGLIGTALLTALLERGDEVVALARSDAAAATLAQRGVRGPPRRRLRRADAGRGDGGLRAGVQRRPASTSSA